MLNFGENILTVIQTDTFRVLLFHLRVNDVSFLLVPKQPQQLDFGLFDLTERLLLLNLAFKRLALSLLQVLRILVETPG